MAALTASLEQATTFTSSLFADDSWSGDRVVDFVNQRRNATIASVNQAGQPHAAVVIAASRVELRAEPALAAAALWDTSQHIEPGSLPRASQMWSDHVQLHAGLGVDDDAERLVPVDDLHEGIEQNYTDGLY